LPGTLDRSRTRRRFGRGRARFLPTVHVSYGRLYQQLQRCADHGCGMPASLRLFTTSNSFPRWSITFTATCLTP
jgi:hypothetical protein